MPSRLLLCFLLAPVFAAAAPINLLRNGSFEGGLLYWHGIDSAKHQLSREHPKNGAHALRIADGYVMSAPFIAERGKSYTVSFWARADKPTKVGVQMPPSAREEGQKAKRLWVREAGQSAEIGPEWKRVSFTWPADVPQSGFWPLPHYMVLIGTPDQTPVIVDGVTVVEGATGTQDYVPRREIEVVTDCPDLPGYAGAAGNVFDRGAKPRLTAHVSNPGKQARDISIRWQLFDYEGETPAGPVLENKVSLPAGATLSENMALELTKTGCVIARVSIHAGDKELDRSEFPLTSLPYPKAPTKPDYRERFGGSFAGGLGVVQKFQRIGFGWIRWRPHCNGHDHLPKEPADKSDPGTWEWTWFDHILDQQEAHGQSSHLVLYPPPKWIMEKGHPLPKDMRWKADDPRWDDLSIETVWDKFVKAATERYKSRSVIFEIENEPEFDRWMENKLGPEYAKFTIRTARQIRKIAPKARIMANNVYGIPSSINSFLFSAGGLKHIDVFSWHDYHAGWLTDAQGIRKMRQNLDEAGGKHVEIWFNEGWAFTNTAVDEPPACTGLTSAESTNAIMCSVAEMSVAGQKKTVLFHTAYEKHGMSFWDYSGPGTMLWDWYSYPLPLVAAWNVLSHHIGISQEIDFIRPPGANFCIFDDLRNGRGVMVAYADRGSKADVTVELPDFGGPLTMDDAMGNAAPAPRKLTLRKSGSPVYLYAAAKTPGKDFAQKLAPLDRKHAGFVSGGDAAPSFGLPPSWEGKEKGSSEGSVAMANGKPVWKLEQLWPTDWKSNANFRAMAWSGTDWNVSQGGFGGQPGAAMKDGVLEFGIRASHGPAGQQFPRTAGLTFVAPEAATYTVSGEASSRIWDGKNRTQIHVLKRSGTTVTLLQKVAVDHQAKVSLEGIHASLEAGEELTFLPLIDGMFAGGNIRFANFRITKGGSASGSLAWRLPAAWEGVTKGSPDGNPISAKGTPVWRIDQLYPDEHIYTANYKPLPWGGTEWAAKEHGQGGQPAVKVENGDVRFSVRGPWNGPGLNHSKTGALVFIAPENGRYRIRGEAHSKPWEGGAKVFPLAVLKKDTQRAAEVKIYDLPREGTRVPIDVEVEVSAGHEIVLLPIMAGAWNNGTATTIAGLTITRAD
jgi:hypothetical protein